MPTGKGIALNIAIVYIYLCFALAMLCATQQVIFAILGIVYKKISRRSNTYLPKERFTVFIPAHNEGSGILPTIASLFNMNYPDHLFSIVVIADNCTDTTEEVASLAGVEVWVRNSPTSRGKGQALAWAFSKLDSTYCDAVVVIDADSKAEPELLDCFNDAIQTSRNAGRLSAYQVRYDFESDEQVPAWLQMVSIASKAAENSFVYRPREVLGLMNLLQGNGFCLPLEVLTTVPWSANSIVEDAEYAIALCLAEIKIKYIDKVRVISRIATNTKDSAPQKTRWAKGMILLISKFVPQLFVQAIYRRRMSFIESGMMLLFISRLTTIYLLLAGIPAIFFVPAQYRINLIYTFLCVIIMQSIFAVLVLCASSEKAYSMANLWMIPRYVAHISAAHVRSIFSLRTRSWTRTVR